VSELKKFIRDIVEASDCQFVFIPRDDYDKIENFKEIEMKVWTEADKQK
jgi:hypothetical protein